MSELRKASILVTGAGGIVGSYADGFMRADRNDFDITDFESTRAYITNKRPVAIIHLAAHTDQKACEDNPLQAYAANAIGAYHVAMAAREVGAVMAYVSTNAVFPGTAPAHTDDVPHPENAYGRSKYAGELLVQGVSDSSLIVRTAWVFGGGEKDTRFVSKIIARKDESEVSAANDAHGTPTYAKDLLEAIETLIREEKRGVFHVVNGGTASRYEMAEEILRLMGSKTSLKPVSRTTFGSSIPKNEILISSVVLRPWKEALAEYIRECYHL